MPISCILSHGCILSSTQFHTYLHISPLKYILLIPLITELCQITARQFSESSLLQRERTIRHKVCLEERESEEGRERQSRERLIYSS